MNNQARQNFITRWHRIFAENDPHLMLPLIHEDIIFYSPAIYRPKQGKQVVFKTLQLVFHVFQDYRVIDTWTKDQDVLFEFEAKVGKYGLQGIDRFRLDETGKIIEMKVWIRPLSGLKELARIVARQELENRLADLGPIERLQIRTKFRTMQLIKSLQEAIR